MVNFRQHLSQGRVQIAMIKTCLEDFVGTGGMGEDDKVVSEINQLIICLESEWANVAYIPCFYACCEAHLPLGRQPMVYGKQILD